MCSEAEQRSRKYCWKVRQEEDLELILGFSNVEAMVPLTRAVSMECWAKAQVDSGPERARGETGIVLKTHFCYKRGTEELKVARGFFQKTCGY